VSFREEISRRAISKGNPVEVTPNYETAVPGRESEVNIP